MSKIIVTVEDPNKLAILKDYLNGLEYVSSVKDVDSYENFLELMTKVCEYYSHTQKFIKPKEIKSEYPELLERLTGGKDNEISFARNIVNFLFGGEKNKPKNPNVLIEHLSNDGKVLLKYIEEGYISFYDIGKALKPNKTKPWLVRISDINEYIKDNINDKKIEISTSDFLKFFEEKTEEYRKQNR